MSWIKMCSTNFWFQAIVIFSLGFEIFAQNDLTVCDNPCPLCPAFIPEAYLTYYPLVTGNSAEFVYCNYSANNVTRYQVFSCPSGFVFSPRSSSNDLRPLCVPAQGSVLSSAGCSGLINLNVSCYGVPSFYCTCVNGIATSLHQCPVGQIFDNQTRTCTVRCTQSGIYGYSTIEEPDTLTGYYTCLFDDRTWLYSMTIFACPADTTFDTDYSFCLPTA